MPMSPARVTISMFALALVPAVAAPLTAQKATALPPILPEQRETVLALSAGPPHIAEGAAVYVLRRGGYVKAREGTNGYTCLVERDHPESLAPICYDGEASASILPGVFRIAELREQGLSYREARERVLKLYGDGVLRPPRRAAMAYMLSPDQVLYSSPDGERVGAWRPHVMMYSPYITNAHIGAIPGDFAQPFVGEEGTATSHIVVVVPEWSRPAPAEAKAQRQH